MLGDCYWYGDGKPRDPEKAVEWWTLAAEQNEPAAMAALGRCYEYGIGVEPNIDRAVELYTGAADLENAEAQFNLAFFILKAQVFPRMKSVLLS